MRKQADNSHFQDVAVGSCDFTCILYHRNMHETPTLQSRKCQEEMQVGGPCSAQAAMPTCWRCPRVLQRHFLTGQNMHSKSDPWQIHREFWAHPVSSSHQSFYLCMHKCAQSAPNSLHICGINTNPPWPDLLGWFVLLFKWFSVSSFEMPDTWKYQKM